MAYKKSSPAMKKKQGYNARLDDSLGAKHGKKKQSMKDRRDESEGMEKSMGKRKYSGNKSSAQGSPAKMSGRAYDMKEAYNKDLSASARLHYLENERHDKDSPMKMYHKSPNKMEMSPLEKELVGKQHNLPEHLKSKIEASPAKMSRELSYGGPVIDKEPGALSHMGASKVLRHMHGSKHSPLKMNGGPGKPMASDPKSDTIRGFDKYNVGDLVSEDDFESKFKLKGKNPKNYPQLSVQDYSEVKEDKKGKYVNRLKN